METSNFEEMLRKEEVEKYSGNCLNLHKYVPPLREGFYKVLNISVSGDAPKNFISVYRYGKGVHKSNCKTWPKLDKNGIRLNR